MGTIFSYPRWNTFLHTWVICGGRKGFICMTRLHSFTNVILYALHSASSTSGLPCLFLPPGPRLVLPMYALRPHVCAYVTSSVLALDWCSARVLADGALPKASWGTLGTCADRALVLGCCSTGGIYPTASWGVWSTAFTQGSMVGGEKERG